MKLATLKVNPAAIDLRCQARTQPAARRRSKGSPEPSAPVELAASALGQ